ncbi:unnamed protein product [Lampetra planeri]
MIPVSHLSALSTFEVHNATLRQQNENLGRRRAKLQEENTTLRAGMEVTRQEFVAMHTETMLQERAMWPHEMLRQGNERLHLENVTLRRKEALLQEIETLRLATAAATAVTNATTANTDTNAKTITATTTATTTAINATNSTPMTKKKKSKFYWFKKHFD